MRRPVAVMAPAVAREQVFVRPGDGRRVRLPGGKVLPAAGAIVPRTLFIERRLLSGDVVEVRERAAGEKK